MNISSSNKPSSLEKPFSVLVIDDSVHDYRSISLMVKNQARNDYVFDWAKNSEEAESKLEKDDIDIVAVDYNLGLEEGSEVIGRLSEKHPDLAFLLVTGNQDPEVYKKGLESGAANFVQKTKDAGVLFDRTAQFAMERKRFENSLKVANASKDWLMSLVEKDLSTPMFALNELLSSAVREGRNMPREMIDDLLDTAHRASCEAILATGQLLEWGRSVHGAVRPTMDMVDISSCVSRTIDLLTPVADERGIYLAKRGSFDFKAYCDERMFSAIVRNLVSSCIHYSVEKSPITIDAIADKRCITIAIKSLGQCIDHHGISYLRGVSNESALEEVTFEEKQALTSIQVASHLLDSMLASLDVKNEKNVGVTFTFKLPLSIPLGLN